VPAALTALSPEPVPWVGGALAVIGYAWLVFRVNRRHPRAPVPAWRIAAWNAGVVVVLVALVTGIDAYADELLTVHMVQHLLLAMIAPPLMALGAPVTLILRAAGPETRRRRLLPWLHASPVRVLASPVVAWALFSAVLWFTHFSPLFELALENDTVHELEHALFLATAILFWWPVVAADPVPHRMGFGGRFVYLFLQMPVSAAVGLAIYFAPSVLYAHYAADRAWGPSPLVDQQIGGLVMWAAGDLIMLAAITGLLAAWVRADTRRARRMDSRLAG
jgi:cytochrome c oxidase assembly factor CtaG